MTTNLLEAVDEVRRHVAQNGRVSLRMLRRQFDLDDETLKDLIEELVDVQCVARREGNALAWYMRTTSTSRRPCWRTTGSRRGRRSPPQCGTSAPRSGWACVIVLRRCVSGSG